MAWIKSRLFGWKLQRQCCLWASQWLTSYTEEEIAFQIIADLIGEPVFFFSKLTEAPLFFFFHSPSLLLMFTLFPTSILQLSMIDSMHKLLISLIILHVSYKSSVFLAKILNLRTSTSDDFFLEKSFQIWEFSVGRKVRQWCHNGQKIVKKVIQIAYGSGFVFLNFLLKLKVFNFKKNCLYVHRDVVCPIKMFETKFLTRPSLYEKFSSGILREIPIGQQ